jgi:RND family efflux transporter MFP subunit
MKKLSIFFLISIVFFACNPDKKTQLDKLVKQRDELNTKIENLQAEIAKTDTTVLIKKAVEVSTLEIKAETFNHFIEIQGKLDGEENAAATAQSMGIVKYIKVAEGDVVKKDQTLAVLSDDVMQQSLKQLQTQLEFVTDLYNRQKALWDQKIGSEVQYLSAKNNKDAVENQIKTMKEQIDMMSIKSPINGTVEEVSIKIGQGIAPGVPLFKIINFSTAKILADISETYSSNIKKGDEVLISFPDLNKEIKAKLDFSSKFINPVNRTFQIIVKFIPDNIDYRANMITILKINDYHKENTIVLPINYIQTENDRKYVYIAENENGKFVAKKHTVKTGKDYNGSIEIIDGIKFGDKVITTGLSDIEDGSSVKL